MRRSLATMMMTFALAGCGGSVSSSDGKESPAAFRPPILTPGPDQFFVETPAQDQQIAAQLIANKNLTIEYNALQQLAQTGLMTADKQTSTPIPSSRYCVLSAPMSQFLRDIDAAHIKMQANLVYPNSHGYHSWPGNKAFPNAIDNCINSASDIEFWQGIDINSFQDDRLLTTIVDLIDSLPPGHYDIGFPRQPYPRDYSDVNGGWSNDVQYGGSMRVGKYIDSGGLKAQYDPETFHKFYWFGSNELSPCQAARGVANHWPGYPASLPPNATTDVSGTTCSDDTSVLQQLNWIKDPNYRAQIIGAYQRAKARGASIDYTFGDGLDHLHLTVHLANQTHRVAFDFDRDGHPDIPWVQSSTGNAAFWLLNGAAYKGNTTIANANVPVSQGWRMLGAADVDGDLRNDLVYFNETTGAISAWLMDDTAFRVVSNFAGVPDDHNTDYFVREVGDFNGDGKPDLFYCGSDASLDYHCDVRDFNGKILSSVAPGLANEWMTVGAYDVDGNGVDDVVWWDSRALRIWYFDNTGSVTMQETNVPPLADDTLEPVMVAPFDGPVGIALYDRAAGKVYIRDLFSSAAPTLVNAPFVVTPPSDWSPNGM